MPFVKRLNTQEAEAALDELREITPERKAAAAEAARLTRESDRLVVKASEHGATRRAVAEAAEITPARVQQILQRHAREH